MKDSRKKSLIKAISWRVCGTLSIFLLSYFFSHELELSLKLSAADFILKLLIYYAHERFWVRF